MKRHPEMVVTKPEAGSENDTGLLRDLTMRDGVAIVAGAVIGSGIFLVPGEVGLRVPGLAAVLGVWLLGGLLTLAGALSLAELGSMFPAAGGLYTYLRAVYGRPVGFLYGWLLLTVINTGSIATLATGFSLYVSQVVAVSAGQRKLLAAGAIVVFTALNLMSLHRAKVVQNLGTVAKLAGIGMLALELFLHGSTTLLRESMPGVRPLTMTGVGVALVSVLWAYEGWHVVSFTAGEFRNPARDLPRSLVLGTLIVVGVYMTLNLAYYSVLSNANVAGAPSTAVRAMQAVGGPVLVRLLSGVIVVSILVSINGLVLTGPRVFYAMAHDGVFFRALGRVSKRGRVPVAALLLQGAWAIGLTLTGQFHQLYTLVISSAWLFYGLSVAAVLVMRWKEPERPRPFRTPWMPWVPALFVLASAGIVISSFISSWQHALMGLGFLVMGLPVYLLFARLNGRGEQARGEKR
ncbi:MAG: amino acid permease [Edaphobacter sp.]|uniref:APC family permease n=1 Tax=Edaphobacter sp. TaxID=1934404 RepID=UPI00239ED28F|nr:amino acid permease [Edaphobacter sp.]MDE1175830.1 amino acid permease [Edaphobacter sp.]